jgi:uncharacterized protein (DUF2267 family)
MVDTGFASFSATVDKTNQVLREIEEAFGWPKERRKQSYAALRAVLHALRDRLTVDEAAQFGAQTDHADPRYLLRRLGSEPGSAEDGRG